MSIIRVIVLQTIPYHGTPPPKNIPLFEETKYLMSAKQCSQFFQRHVTGFAPITNTFSWRELNSLMQNIFMSQRNAKQNVDHNYELTR